MLFYFSGVSSAGDAALLKAAGVQYVLADQFDIGTVFNEFPHVALDSGAFRAMRQHIELNLYDYFEAALELRSSLDFVVNMDVIGNPEQSWSNWLTLRLEYGLDAMPVWHYDVDRTYLNKYLDSGCQLIGIGGLAGILRDRENPARVSALRSLVQLCGKYPDRFHVFGLNWVKAINELRDGLHSADSSLWLRGARYGQLIFQNSRSGKLSQAPEWVIANWAEKNGKDKWYDRSRTDMLKANARHISGYCNG